MVKRFSHLGRGEGLVSFCSVYVLGVQTSDFVINFILNRVIENGISGNREGTQILTDQKRENSAFSLLIG